MFNYDTIYVLQAVHIYAYVHVVQFILLNLIHKNITFILDLTSPANSKSLVVGAVVGAVSLLTAIVVTAILIIRLRSTYFSFVYMFLKIGRYRMRLMNR